MQNLVQKSLACIAVCGFLSIAHPALAACGAVGVIATLQQPDAATLIAIETDPDTGEQTAYGCSTVSLPLQTAGSAAASTSI
ncbi:MAG: hypothetical protein ACR2QF_04055, partial [Geminicoccaceae bacterium]